MRPAITPKDKDLSGNPPAYANPSTPHQGGNGGCYVAEPTMSAEGHTTQDDQPLQPAQQPQQRPGRQSGDDEEAAKWAAMEDTPGCCWGDSAGCCFASHGACCFSDHGGCCFSDHGGCCFSDHEGCCFSDNKGCWFSSRGGACWDGCGGNPFRSWWERKRSDGS